MGGVILVSEGVGCNFWPREGCKNEVPAMGTPLLPPPVPMCDCRSTCLAYFLFCKAKVT